MSYIAPKKWEECGRDDLQMIPKMIEMGFTPIFSYQDKMYKRTTINDVPHDCVSFEKDNVRVWKKYERKNKSILSKWICADLIDGHYVNHRDFILET